MSLRNLAFSVEEYRHRVAQVQIAMMDKGLYSLLVNNRADICYLAGMENCYMVPYYAAIIPARGEPILITSDFEILNALVGVWCEDRVTFPVASADPIEATCQILASRGFASRKVGVQLLDLTADCYFAIKRYLPKAVIVNADDILQKVKIRKSSAEIAYMKKAGKLSTQAMESAIKTCKRGIKDNDIAAAACEVLIRGGSEFMCIEPIVTVGERSGIPHSTFRRTLIQPGDAIFIELGACICRYSSPLMRTVAITPIRKDIRCAAAACRDSLNVLIENMKPGAIAREVAAKAKSAWRTISEKLIWHGIYAYSIGLGFPPDWNDVPACITTESDLLLEPGMCFHATTSLREGGKYGTALSETVLITESGNEVLTGTKRELFVV